MTDKKNVETVKVFQDGEWKTYTRDLTKQPLNIEDWMNATKLDVVTHNWNRQFADDNSDMKMAAVKPYVEGTLKFIVSFFRDQFNFEQAKTIKPEVINTKLNDWYAMSAGVMGVLNNAEAKK